MFPLVYLALKRRGATDWRSGVEIDLDHQGKAHLIQFHHIFPKARIRELYDAREVNEISNMAFVSGRTNRRISAELPKLYLPKVAARSADALRAQCVPQDPGLWELTSFPAFLEARRTMLTEAVNALVQSATT